MNKTTGGHLAIITVLALAVVVVIGFKMQRADSSPERSATTAAPVTPSTPATTPAQTSPVQPGEVCPPAPETTTPTTSAPKPTTPSPTTPTTQANTPSATAKTLPRMLDLGSETCKPCIMMIDVMAALRKEYPDTLQVDFIDVNKSQEAAAPYGIQFIPTQIFFDATGKEIFRHVGYYPKEDIVAKFKELGITL